MLTYRQLKDIQEGHRRNPDVMDLLREVKRLRAVAVLSYSVVGFIRLCDLSKEDQAKFEPLFEALKAEQCVQGWRRAREKREHMNFPHETEGRDGDMAYYWREMQKTRE
ncbi:hypothetical protein [Allopusillimonas soli]|uniref:Uncharacterized protein n=1 Tax=Allopusillimonas soli TaxID=659016 RepID=A0A853FJD8_9BURK|nr:hypothetical protein [Allopusillimonas soli]NYT38850.1 hypothetical protein [Allopusillimonas soli]